MNKSVMMQNAECLTQIPEIIREFRTQSYFRASCMLVVLINNLHGISGEILDTDDARIDRDEWLAMLTAIMEAQKNKDGILIADILEGDLLPYLQKLQILWQQEKEIQLPNYLEANINSIRKTDEALYQSISREKAMQVDGKEPIYESFLAISGLPVASASVGGERFCLCSTVNPAWEGKLLAESIPVSASKEYWVFGVGMGYHVDALLKADHANKVTLLLHETETLSMALCQFDWHEVIESGHLSFLYDAGERSLLENLKKKNEDAVFFIHYPTLRCVMDGKVRELLEDYFVASSSMLEQKALLDKNFDAIQKHGLPECGELKEQFAGAHVVIAGGGPSVDGQMEAIRAYRGKMVLLTVGTVARKFLENGIVPDAIMITDPKESIAAQIKGLETEKIPLIILSTAPEKLLAEYKGSVYVAYQEGYEPACGFAKNNGYTVFQTGGSVVTLAIDLAIRFGAADITLVGTDMAYTGGRSHAGGLGRKIAEGMELRKVLSVTGEYIETSRNLDIYRKWIEHRIEDVRGLVVYNTARGARIKGTIEKTLCEIAKTW